MDIKMQIYSVYNSQFINMKFYRLFSFSLEMWIGTGLHVYLCNMCLPGASRCQERVLDALDLKLDGSETPYGFWESNHSKGDNLIS